MWAYVENSVDFAEKCVDFCRELCRLVENCVDFDREFCSFW